MKKLLLVILLLSLPIYAFANKSSHEQAAQELLEALNLQQNMDEALNQSLKAHVRSNPQMAEYEDVLREFYTKYSGYEALKADIVELYVNAFSEQELRETTAFYKTNTGRKIIGKLPLLMQEGSKIGEQKVRAHRSELDSMLQAASNSKEVN